MFKHLPQIVRRDDQFGVCAPQLDTLHPDRENLPAGGVKGMHPAAVDLQPPGTRGFDLLQRRRQGVKIVLRHSADRPVAYQMGRGSRHVDSHRMLSSCLSSC